MWKRVVKHALYWSAAERMGTVFLELEDTGEGRLTHLSKEELAAFGDLLRNEEPIWYHSTRGDLSTESKPKDEQERT